jgi:hypothetical protein
VWLSARSPETSYAVYAAIPIHNAAQMARATLSRRIARAERNVVMDPVLPPRRVANPGAALSRGQPCDLGPFARQLCSAGGAHRNRTGTRAVSP